MQRAVTCANVFRSKRRGGEHQAHQRARLTHNIWPVGVAYRAQRRDGVAHAQIVCGLLDALLRLNGGLIGQRGVQPVLIALRVNSLAGGVPVAQPLAHLP